MRQRFLTVLVFACWYVIAPYAAIAGGDEPSASDLIAMAPVISNSDGKCRSIVLAGYVREGGMILRFRVIYRAPDHHLVMVTDGLDDTPFFIAAERKAILFNPIQPIVGCSTDVASQFDIHQQGTEFDFGWGLNSKKGLSSTILLDIKSLFSGPSKGDAVVKTGERLYRLTRTSKLGNFLVAQLDLSRPQPYQKIEIIDGDTGEVSVSIDTIEIDGPIDDVEFEIPSKEQLAGKLAVRDLGEKGLLKSIGAIKLMFESCFFRLAIHEPELREDINKLSLKAIDWDEVERNDKKFSEALKEAIASRRTKRQR